MKVPGLPDGALANYFWLTSDAALPYLTRCADHTGELTRLVSALRKELSPERAHLVIEQVELRRRAKAKFLRAEEMFFTRKGLEQATDHLIAKYKAERAAYFRSSLVDICCGIGGDLIAFERAGNHEDYGHCPVSGVDLDPIVAHLASENFRRITGSEPLLEVKDANLVDVTSVSCWHVDPDRRAQGQRRTQLEGLEPTGEVIDRWRAQNDRGAVKLAPATQVPETWQQAAEREWISSRGECRQQMIWFGEWNKTGKPGSGSPPTSNAGLRTATVMGRRQKRSVYEQPGTELVMTDQVGRFLYEPDAAVLAARLSASLAAEYHVEALTSDGGYLTGETLIVDAAVQVFETQAILPYDLRRIKSLLRDRNIGRLEIKKRGVNETPEAVRKSMALQGDEEATLIIYSRNDQEKSCAILARRIVGDADKPI